MTDTTPIVTNTPQIDPTPDPLLHQPVSDIQLQQLVVEWVPRETVRPNQYNPNQMTWHDRMLLRQSLLEDGWTQPIVTLLDGTIVDGEQRWTTAGIETTPQDVQEVIAKMEQRRAEGAVVSESILARLHEAQRRLEAAVARGERPTLAAITGGLVPITRLDLGDDAHKMISTIRHNRARGTHRLDSMAGIAADLVQLGLDFDDLEVRLGMDDEEIGRLLDTAAGLRQADALLDTLGSEDFSTSWAPVHIADLTEDEVLLHELALSQQASAAHKVYAQQVAEREATIRQQTEAIAARRKAGGEDVNADVRAQIEQQVKQSLPPAPPRPPALALRKFMVFVTPAEYDFLLGVLGDQPAQMLLALCRAHVASQQQAESTGEAIQPEGVAA